MIESLLQQILPLLSLKAFLPHIAALISGFRAKNQGCQLNEYLQKLLHRVTDQLAIKNLLFFLGEAH
jgi:hypothetical protein